MNILIFSPIPSHPNMGGSRKRVFNLTKYLQNMGHRIHFVYFIEEQKGLTKDGFNAMQEEWESLTIIHKTKSIQRSTEGYELDEWYQEDIAPIVNKVIKLFNIDTILLNYIVQSKLLEFVPKNVLKIIDTHDSFADRHLLFKMNTKVNYTWYSVSKEDEIKALNRADIVFAIQNNEAEYFSPLTNSQVKVINHLEDSHFLPRSYKKLKKIGFIGVPNYVNEHSMSDFLKAFTKHPISNKIKVVIAGTVAHRIKSDHKNIILRGPVENLEDFYKEVDLVLNPSMIGTGLKIKSVEALSYGVPIISTVIGFEGIDSHHHCHQLNTHEEMVECIQELYNHPKKLSELAKLSAEIFNAYETNVKNAIASVFGSHTKSHGYDLQSINQKQNKTILELYKQVQTSLLKGRETDKKIIKQQKNIDDLQEEIKRIKNSLHTIFDKIHKVIITSGKVAPIKKYKAYKEMLKTYNKIK